MSLYAIEIKSMYTVKTVARSHSGKTALQTQSIIVRNKG